MLEKLIPQLAAARPLADEQVRLAVEQLTDEKVPVGVKADFLIALAKKGETPGEIAAFARAFRFGDELTFESLTINTQHGHVSVISVRDLNPIEKEESPVTCRRQVRDDSTGNAASAAGDSARMAALLSADRSSVLRASI